MNVQRTPKVVGAPAWTMYDAEILGDMIRRVTPSLAGLSLQIVESYDAEFEEYARLRPDDRDLVIETAYLHLKSLMKELTDETPETSFNGFQFSRVGAIRMRMGISLDALLRSFNVWGRAITGTFREHVDFDNPRELQTLFYVSERISWHVEHGMASMGAGYMREAGTTWSDRELTRFSVLDALITGRLDALELNDSSWSDRQLTDSYAVIVALPREQSREVLKRPQDSVRKTTRLFTKLVPNGKWLVGSRDGLLYVLWPEGDSGLTMSTQKAAEALAEEFPEMAFGIGNHYPDLSGIKPSYEEAGEAATIANCLSSDSPLVFRELLLERLAQRNRLLHELARDTLRPLLDYDRRKHASLFQTLEAYVNSGCNVADAGKSLFVHPNTVVYRLRRVEEISGFDPRSADGLLKLSLSLLVYKFLLHEDLTTETDTEAVD